ncbi:MAG: hypothetical protein GY855_01245 [candidate division Zixibacteria bacterium]|nr:hypothetical protein [candidate division Zixibacteria bacterium]
MRKLDIISTSYSWGIAAGLTAYVTMLSGLFGVLNSEFAFIWLIVLLLLSILSLKTSKIVSAGRNNCDDNKSISKINIIVLLIIISSFLLLSAVGSLAPPVNIDVLNYHFALLKQYMLVESLDFNPTFLHAATPASAEMLSGFIAVLSNLKGGQLIQFISFIFLLIAVYGAGKKELNKSIAIIAVAIFCSTLFLPFIISDAKNDQLLGLFSFLSLYGFASAHKDSNSKMLFLGAIFSGLACGVKVYGLAVPLSGYLILLIMRFADRNELNYRSLFYSFILMFLITSPWYIRSIVLTCNPVHPFYTNIFSDRYWDSVLEVAYNRRWGSYVKTGIWRFLISPLEVTFNPDLYKARLGPILFSILPLSIFFRSKNKTFSFLGMVSAVYFVVWFFFLKDARFLLPILPGLALYSAGVLGEFMKRYKMTRHIIVAVLIVNLTINTAISFKNNYKKIPVVIGMETINEFYMNYMEIDRKDPSSGRFVRAIPEYSFLQKVNTILNINDAVGVYAYNEPMIYYFIDNKVYLMLPFLQNVIDFKSIESFEDLTGILENYNIRYIITKIDNDKNVPSHELLFKYPEYESSLRGAKQILSYLLNECEVVIADGPYRCFKVP